MSQWALASLALLFTGALGLGADESLSRSRFLMGTACQIDSDGSMGGTEAAFEEISRVEALISTWRDDSELATLNDRASIEPAVTSEELYALIEVALDWSRRTNGAFSPLIAPLLQVWDVRGAGTLPGKEEIALALSRSSLDTVILDPATGRVGLKPGSAIEEGAFGKGYAIGRAMEVLVEGGCSHCLINFGGQISVRSATPLSIAIARPDSRAIEAVRVTLAHGSISTTSGSEKWLDTSAGRFSHVIDPRTGRAVPLRGSATVIHESALVADILSTALYVMGPDEGLRWSEEHDVAVIFIVPDGDEWIALASSEANNPGLSLTVVSPDVGLKGVSLNVP